jgi:hypothetical protein
MRDGFPIVKRKSVSCILRNPKNNKYAYLKWNNEAKWATFIGGGIDGDEDIIEASKREIVEESGYKNVKFIKNLGDCYSSGFAIHKNENRFSFITCFIFLEPSYLTIDLVSESIMAIVGVYIIFSLSANVSLSLILIRSILLDSDNLSIAGFISSHGPQPFL